MDNFSINVIPYPNEFLPTFILKVLRENILELPYFYNNFVGPQNHHSNYVKRFDSYLYLENFFKSLGLNLDEAINFFLKHSIYLAVSPFIKDSERTSFIGFCFSDFYEHRDIWQPNRIKYVSSLKICPECQREDVENYGEWYYHLPHQIAGVDICHKHRCALYSHDWEFGLRIHDLIFDEMLPIDGDGSTNFKGFKRIEVKEDELCSSFLSDYAEFMALLLNQETDSDIKNKWILRLENDREIDKFLTLSQEKAVGFLGKSIQNSTEDTKERILYYLKNGYYPSEDKYDDSNEKNFGYKIIKDMGDDICLCKCTICGKEFISTRQALSIGYTCACGRKGVRKEEIIRRLIDNKFKDRFITLYIHKANNSYHVFLYDTTISKTLCIKPATLFLKNFDDFENSKAPPIPLDLKNIAKKDLFLNPPYTLELNQNSYVMHCKKCGKSPSFRYKEKYLPECLYCKYDGSQKEAKKIVKDYGGAFVLKDEKNKTNQDFALLHKECGHYICRDLKALREGVSIDCTHCGKRVYKKSYLKKKRKYELKEIYSVLKRFNGEFSFDEDQYSSPLKIPLVHNICGTPITIKLNDLRNNKNIHCKTCKKLIKKHFGNI